MEKVTVQVLAPDDVGVSALYPANGTTYLAGDIVDINATIHNYASYLEAEVPVNLTITGPNGYTFFSGLTVTGLSGGTDKPANFTWQTSSLGAGTYTINVSTELSNDPKTSNDSISRTITLQQKPALSITASTNQTSYGQATPILLSASVIDPASAPVPAALVYANITGPSVTEIQVMAYNTNTQKYEIGLAYLNTGVYQYAISGLKRWISGRSDRFPE